MRKSYSGYCPAQDCQYTIHLDYIASGDTAIPGLIDCVYLGLHNPPECKNCEMLKQAKADQARR